MIFVMTLGVVVGIGLMLVPLSARIPRQGLRSWMRESVANRGRIVQDSPRTVSLDEFLSDPEPAVVYMTPDILKGRLDGVKQSFGRK